MSTPNLPPILEKLSNLFCNDCAARRYRIWDFDQKQDHYPKDLVTLETQDGIPKIVYDVYCYFYKRPVYQPVKIIHCDAWQDREPKNEEEEAE
jgi:hypothetical protein